MSHPPYPIVLQRFHHLPGQYGAMDVVATSPHGLVLRLTEESVELNREDAEEMIRVLARWLAGPEDVQVVRTHGSDSSVTVVDDGPGRPSVTIYDRDPPQPVATGLHFDAVTTHLGTAPIPPRRIS